MWRPGQEVKLNLRIKIRQNWNSRQLEDNIYGRKEDNCENSIEENIKERV